MLGEEADLGARSREDAPGSQNEDWDLLLRAAKRAPIRHLDEPLIEVAWGRTSFFAHQYDTKISSLRWMMERHPEIGLDGVGAGRVYGQLACWSAARGDRSGAMHWVRQAVRSNWREPRAAIALAALSGAVRVETRAGRAAQARTRHLKFFGDLGNRAPPPCEYPGMGYAQRAARAWAGLATAVAGLSAVAVFGLAGARGGRRVDRQRAGPAHRRRADRVQGDQRELDRVDHQDRGALPR